MNISWDQFVNRQLFINITVYLYHVQYSGTVNIWIPDSMGVWYSNGEVTWIGRPFKYHTFWTTKRLFSLVFRPPFEYQTGLVFRWLLYWLAYKYSHPACVQDQVRNKLQMLGTKLCAWRFKVTTKEMVAEHRYVAESKTNMITGQSLVFWKYCKFPMWEQKTVWVPVGRKAILAARRSSLRNWFLFCCCLCRFFQFWGLGIFLSKI